MNETLVIILLTVVVVQSFKAAIDVIHKKKFSWKSFVRTGGMPSSHTAFVTSLCTGVYLFEGFSMSFTISIALALIVMRDAIGVRRTVGEEGKILKYLMKKNNIKKKFHESPGHTPMQVLAGGLIGIGFALLVYFL